jgi:hypothetical protein
VVLHPEDEQHLHEIARRFHADDPSLAAYLAGATRRRRPRLVLLTVYLVPVGLVTAGLAAGLPDVFVAGIIAAPVTPLAGAWLVRSPARRRREHAARPPDPGL